jgi:hypothetical protein
MFSFLVRPRPAICDEFVANVRRELEEIETRLRPTYDALDALFAASKREKKSG